MCKWGGEDLLAIWLIDPEELKTVYASLAKI